MAESLTSSSGVSRQIYADIKSAFRAYAQTSNRQKTEEENEEKTYADRGQLTRQVYRDIQSTLAERQKASEKQETEQAAEETKNNAAVNTETAQAVQTQEKVEVKTFTLPKNTQTIISELKRDGLHRTLSPYNIAEKYGISYMKAREILDELNKDSNGFVREYKLPENSTVSYKV